MILLWISSWTLHSQLIGTSGYILGDNLEIGINDGGFEGAPRLVASNNRSNQALGSPVYFGFVANPQLDGWGNYDGDFFTPGTPENGFGLEINGINYANNASGPIEQIPGSITSYNVVGDCIFIEWDGVVANVAVHIVYRLITTELYYTTEVTLTNIGPTPLANVYYYRNLDPDNNVTIGGGYSTQNTIEAQPSPACEKALVTATQPGPWSSYMGLGAIGENFRVAHGGFANRDASNIWNGIGFASLVGASVWNDAAIALGYRVETLAVGVPERFLFTVVLDASQIDAAIASLYYFDYVGGGGVIDECAPVIDTARTCAGNPVTITVDGPSADDYIWTWAPPIGLSTVDGPTTDASPAVTTEYTVTGVPAALCLSASIEKTIVVQVTPSPIIEIIDPGPQCGDFDLTTLVINNVLPGGAPVEIEFYSVIPDSVDQVVGIWPSDFMTVGDTVYILMYDPVSGCYDVDPVAIDFSGGAVAGPDNTSTLCNSLGSTLDLNTLLVGAEPAGLWSETSVVLSGGFNPVTGVLNASGVDAGVYTFEYIALGIAPCENDTAVMTITINQEPLAGLDNTMSICNMDGTTTDLDDLLDGNNAIGTWVEVTASGQFTPGSGVFDASGLPAGDYIFTYTVTGIAPCIDDVASFTITVDPLPIINAGADVAICIGEGVTLSGTGAGVGGTYVWDFGVIDGVEFSPAGTATYTLTGTDANGCINTDMVVVTVNPLPVINAGLDHSVCIGDATTLTGTGAGIGGGYVWDGGVVDGVSFVPAATATFTVIGTDANGCEGSDEVVVTVLPLPIITAGPDVAICIGESTVLEASGAGVGGIYVWDGGVVDGVSFTPAATADYTVTGTTIDGCVNTDLVTVTVNPLPIINAGADVAICAGEGVTLSGTGAGVGGTYVWDFGVIDGVEFFPAGTATYTLTGTDANGCINTDMVVVTVNPLPVIDAGLDHSVCTGDATTLIGTGAGIGGGYVWDGGVVDGVSFVPAATATFTVIGTDANGCEGSDEVVVTVLPLPIITAGPDVAICIGESTVLEASGAGVGGIYVWDGGVVDGVSFTPAATADYTVTGTTIDGCVNTDLVTVTVNPLPIVDAGLDTSICAGESIALVGAGAGIAAEYLWTDGGIDGVPFAPMTTNTYTVTGTDINGCVNTDDVTVTILDLPVIDAGLSHSICIGDATTLTATGLEPGGTYSWTGGVVNGVEFTPAATATYTVVGTDLAGCIGSDNVTVTLIPLPLVNAGPDQEVCFGDALTLTGSGAGLGGTYTWGEGIFNGVSFTPLTSGNYTVTGTTTEGCVNTDVVNVTVNPLPIVVFNADVVMGCAPLAVNFESPTDGSIYHWNFGDGATGTTDDITHVFLHSGVYDISLEVTSVDGCVASATYESYIDVMETPIAQFTYAPNEIDIIDTRVQFVNNSEYADIYEWDFGDGSALTAEENPMHAYAEIGNRNYNVKLVASNSNGCVDEYEQLIMIKDVLLFYIPNAFTPDGDTFNEEFKPIFVSGLDIFDYHLMIFNRWGELVFESYNADYGWPGTYGDGGIVTDEVFTWKLDFGDTMSDKRHYDVGTVTVLK